MYLIALVDKNWGIAADGKQIIYIPEDLKHFKDLTMGKTCITGRKTLSSFPKGEPLKGRRNIILSRNKALKIEGAEVLNDIESLLKATEGEEAFLTGGASLYNELLPYCERAYITFIDKDFSPDKFIPNLDKDPSWTLKEEKGGYKYEDFTFSFRIYERERV